MCVCRDLAENWNIDVARELEDYLEELESLTISIPDGNRNLNFAEAALLIQVRFKSSLCRKLIYTEHQTILIAGIRLYLQ